MSVPTTLPGVVIEEEEVINLGTNFNCIKTAQANNKAIVLSFLMGLSRV